MIKHIRGLLIIVGLGMSLFTGIDSYAQTLAKHNWYFGSTQRSIRFNRVTNVATLVTNKAVPFGTGGSATATDRGNGNLLFYTDGNQVYDANHTAMPNGGGLNGNATANQPVAICPIPGQLNKYFVFTNNASFTTGGTVSYSVVDMSLFGSSAFPAPALGDVESKNSAIPGITNVSEGMITLPHANGRDFWLLTQQAGTLAYNATLINAASYSGTFNTTTTTVSGGSVFPTTASHFAYHEGLKQLAVAPQVASTNVMIFGFDESTGALTWNTTIANSGVLSTTNQAIYDVEWSPDGRFLYISRYGETPTIQADLLQYDFQNPSTTLASVLPGTIFHSYGLQRAPDSLIYHLYQKTSGGPFLIGRIESPDSVAAKAKYNDAPALLATLDFGGMQFPGFVPKDTIELDLDFTYIGMCQNSPTTFFPAVTPGADSLTWDFSDGSTGAGWSPIHKYTEAGSFDVKMTAFYQGQVKSTTKSVTINDFQMKLTLPSDTTACRDEFPPPRGHSSPKQFSVDVKIDGGTPTTIVWSNGDMGKTLTPDSAGYYYVVVTDASTCSAYAGVTVKEYGKQTTEYNKWYFGNKAGIDFTTRKPLAESAMDAPEGCAIACDKNGQQIFYTDGSTVWDKTHTIIATNIGGDPLSTQSSLIVPVPDDETMFYIFTTQDLNNGTDLLQLNYSLFDLKQNSGKGQVVKQGVFLFVRSTERVTSDGQWIIVHDLGNSTFRAYAISADGIGNQVYTDIGSEHRLAIPANGTGYMMLGPTGIVAVPLTTPGVSNKIDLVHLNDSTGVLSNYKSIDLGDTDGQIYGMDMANDDQRHGVKLFVSMRYIGGTSAIFEYHVDSLLNATFLQKLPVAADIGAIETGPDGKIYVATNNSGANTSLGVITEDGDPTKASGFQLNGFQLAGGTNSRLGLPNFIQIHSDPQQGPGITVTGLCLGDSTQFQATGRDVIDFYSFTVLHNGAVVASQPSDGNSPNPNFKVKLTEKGDYTVTVTLHNRCAADSLMRKNFTIDQGPDDVHGQANLCGNPTVTLHANPKNIPDLTFEWTTGETTDTLVVNQTGEYTVTITDATGCKGTGDFIAGDTRPIFELGPDVTICQNESQPALNVQNPGMNYKWTINTVPASTTAIQPVDTSVPNVYKYEVTVTDPVTTCARTDDKTYTVNVSPDYIALGHNPSSCGNANGSVEVDLHVSVPAGGPLYSYFIQGPGGNKSDTDQSAPNTFTLTNVTAGTYSVVVTDQLSTCTIPKTVGLSDATWAVTSVVTDNCKATLSVSTTGGTTPYSYTLTNTSGTVVASNNSVPRPFVLTPIPGGDYTVSVQDAGGCIATKDLNITLGPSVPITFTPDLCSLTLTASGATSYTWSALPASGIASGASTPTINLTPNAGIVTYKVIATQAGFCDAKDSTTLKVGNIIAPALSQSTECDDNVTITATPDGSYTYRWFVNGTYDGSLGGNTVLADATDNGKNYHVTLYEPQSGCTRTSADIPVSVIGVVDAALSSTPPCQDGQPITLTATTHATGVGFAWSRDGVAIPDVTTAVTQQTAEGKYEVDVTKSTCKAVATLVILRAPLPEGSLPNQVTICDDPENDDPATKSYDLDPGVFVAYEWTKNEVLLNYHDRVLTADSKGDYQVKITDARGCTNIDKAKVLNDCLPKLNAPNAFRPGSIKFNPDRHDLTNSDFWIFTRFIEDDNFKVFIFNRWGEMVYSSTDRYFKWNGGYNNDLSQPAPPGTYAYVLMYVSTFRPNEGVKEKRGGVALIR